MMDLCGFEGSPCLLRHPKKNDGTITPKDMFLFFVARGGGATHVDPTESRT